MLYSAAMPSKDLFKQFEQDMRAAGMDPAMLKYKAYTDWLNYNFNPAEWERENVEDDQDYDTMQTYEQLMDFWNRKEKDEDEELIGKILSRKGRPKASPKLTKKGKAPLKHPVLFWIYGMSSCLRKINTCKILWQF